MTFAKNKRKSNWHSSETHFFYFCSWQINWFNHVMNALFILYKNCITFPSQWSLLHISYSMFSPVNSLVWENQALLKLSRYRTWTEDYWVPHRSKNDAIPYQPIPSFFRKEFTEHWVGFHSFLALAEHLSLTGGHAQFGDFFLAL